MFSLSKSVSKLRSLSKTKSDETSGGKPIDVKKAKLKKSKKSAKIQGKPNDTELSTGVVSISNIPHGFYEKQMFAYFSQFGRVLRLRISRNKKTGKRRNYGFIEFECEEVAKIVANTMNNYLMFDQILKCQLIPKEKLKEKPKLFKNWDKHFVSTTLLHKSSHNKNKDIEREFKLMRKRLRNVRQMEALLKQKGIDFKCEVIGLPDMTKLRQQSNQKPNQTIVELKTPKMDRQIRQQKTPKSESYETVILSSKSSEKKRKGFKTPIYPRLLKFSIMLSANKKRIN